MSSTDAFIATVLGGFIAGVTGLLTSRYDRRLHRRESHLQEHKANFEAIQKALVALKSDLWPLTAKGAENLMLPRQVTLNLRFRLKNYRIADFQLLEAHGGGLGAPELEITMVDRVLYSDIEAHFPELSTALSEIEKMTRTDGVRLDELVYEVSKAVYDAMTSSDLPVLRFTFDQGKKALLREIPTDGLEGQQYAGFLFLILIGEDTGNWPNSYGQLTRYGLFTELQKLSEEIRSKINTELTTLLRLRGELFSKMDRTETMIEELRHQMKMKHGCPYV